MELGHFFEALMLICFGFSWPLNVIKAYKARTVKGTSLAFILLIITGYLAGITAKFINNQINYVLAVYFLNLIIVMANIVVYFRNKALDKKRASNDVKKKIFVIQQKYKNQNINSSEDSMNFNELNNIAKLNQVILMGNAFDKAIPVTELAQSFEFNFELYNRSDDKLSLANAKDYFEKNVAALLPEGIILHLGENDLKLFMENSADFDKYYLDLISAITSTNKKCRIAIVSVLNPNNNDNIRKMNAHIKAISDSSKATYINLDNAKLWNPSATKEASSFARSMGLSVRTPLSDVAEILYSYACLELNPATMSQDLVG